MQRPSLSHVLTTLVLGLVFTAAMPAAAAFFPPEGAQLEGGDDSIVSLDPRLQPFEANKGLAIDSEGRIFAALQMEDPVSGTEVQIFLSDDHGRSWRLWSRRYDPDPEVDFQRPLLALVPGADEHVALVHERVERIGPLEYVVTIRVSVSPSAAAVPTWTTRDATTASFPDVDAVLGPNGPILYVTGLAVDRVPVVTRSTDLGQTWSAPIALEDPFAPGEPNGVRVAGDDTGQVLVAWLVPQYTADNDWGARQITATGFGASAADWEAQPTVVESNFNGLHAYGLDVAAQRDGSGLAVVWSSLPLDQGRWDTEVRTAPGVEGPWAVTQPQDTAHYLRLRIEERPNGGWALGGSAHEYFDIDRHAWAVSLAADTIDPDFGTEIVLSDTWGASNNSYPSNVAVHPQFPDEAALLWIDNPFDQVGIPRFDATWWSGPGAPALVDGFPVHLSVEPVTHPAVVDVTARSAGDEIVYGDADGVVHVVDHLGDALPGWPQAVGAMQHGQAIAVGDLDGDGDVEVVVPNASGEVHVFEHDGTRRAGWPVDLGVRAAHVSLGPVSGLSTNDVVAVCGTEAFLLRANGTIIDEYGTWPVSLSEMAGHPASIGDVDADGRLEVVITTGDALQVFDREGQLLMSQSTGFDPFVGPAALGDLDRDGDLEIVAATHGSDVHGWHHDGGVLAGQWPIDAANLGAIAGLSIANLEGSADPEVVATGSGGFATVFQSDGSTRAGWPQTLMGSAFAPAVIDDIDGLTAEVLVLSDSPVFGDGLAIAWAEDATLPFPWPKGLPVQSTLSPATGDVDGDGHLDFVVLSTSKLLRYDLSNPVSVDAFLRWTQYGHDARRTHCAESSAVATSVDSEGSRASVRIAFAPPAPNPMRDGVTHLSFSLPQDARARVEVFDLRGRRVRVLNDDTLGAGHHTLIWNGRDEQGRGVANGTYLGRLVVELPGGTEVLARKVTVMQ